MRRRAMALCAEPTPGSSTRGARWMTPRSLVTTESAPRRASAARNEAMLAPPLSMMTTLRSQDSLGRRQLVTFAAKRLAQRAARHP